MVAPKRSDTTAPVKKLDINPAPLPLLHHFAGAAHVLVQLANGRTIGAPLAAAGPDDPQLLTRGDVFGRRGLWSSLAIGGGVLVAVVVAFYVEAQRPRTHTLRALSRRRRRRRRRVRGIIVEADANPALGTLGDDLRETLTLHAHGLPHDKGTRLEFRTGLLRLVPVATTATAATAFAARPFLSGGRYTTVLLLLAPVSCLPRAACPSLSLLRIVLLFPCAVQDPALDAQRHVPALQLQLVIESVEGIFVVVLVVLLIDFIVLLVVTFCTWFVRSVVSIVVVAVVV